MHGVRSKRHNRLETCSRGALARALRWSSGRKSLAILQIRCHGSRHLANVSSTLCEVCLFRHETQAGSQCAQLPCPAIGLARGKRQSGDVGQSDTARTCSHLVSGYVAVLLFGSCRCLPFRHIVKRSLAGVTPVEDSVIYDLILWPFRNLMIFTDVAARLSLVGAADIAVAAGMAAREGFLSEGRESADGNSAVFR
jgi:hypothetical protein